MSPLSSPRPSRTALLFLMLTLLVAGVEVWGIGASLGYLLR